MKEKVALIGGFRITRGRDWWIADITGVNRIHIVHSGEVLCRIGTKKYTLKSGMIYLLPQNLAFEPFPDESTEYDHTFIDFVSAPLISMEEIVSIKRDENPIIDALAKIFENFDQKKYFSQSKETVEAFIEVFLSVLKREYALKVINDPVTTDATVYIHKNFSKQISVSEIAKTLHIDKYVFIRRFKKFTGLTPYQYIKKHRINYALSLIKEGNRTLSEIANLAGYSDQSALSHSIKATLGAYPIDIAKSK